MRAAKVPKSLTVADAYSEVFFKVNNEIRYCYF